MNKPVPVKITVATVTFNAASLLPRTIASVESQDYPQVEHVVVDGKSHDGTLQLLQEYRQRAAVGGSTHELKIVSEPDRGLYDAMNKAIGMATGDYILFLNAGDKLHSTDTLRHIADIARSHAYGEDRQLLPAVVYGNTNIVDNDGRFLYERRLTPPEQLSWKSFRSGMLVCHQAFFARTDLARQNPYQLKYRFSADFDWCIRIMRQAEAGRIPLTNAHIVVADYLEGGLTTKNHRKSLLERFNIMRHHYGLLPTVCMHLYFVLRNLHKA
jgi:glycosyltransferase involved in cell wall biosynthesis